MITERTLRKWRGEALRLSCDAIKDPERNFNRPAVELILAATSHRILRLTQELLDQHLLRKEMK